MTKKQAHNKNPWIAKFLNEQQVQSKKLSPIQLKARELQAKHKEWSYLQAYYEAEAMVNGKR